MFLLCLFGCNRLEGEGGQLGQGAIWPFPSMDLVQDGHLAIPPDQIPKVDTPLPLERLEWRTGFSPLQTAVVQLEGVHRDALPEMDPLGGGVQIIDLDSGEELPCFAELDAHPGSLNPALLVRPQAPMPLGHRVAVVVSRDIAERPERVQALLDGDLPSDLSEDQAEHYVAVYTELGELGLDIDEIALAWDFPIGDGTHTLRQVVGGTGTPSAWTIQRVVDSDEDPGALPEGVWRKITGTFTTTNWLVDDFHLDLAPDGSVTPTGDVEADLYIHIPESVRDKDPGTVPVIVFGHGLLRDPALFLNDDDDTGHFIELFNRMEVIVIATTWRGLTREDTPDVVWAANDLGRFNEVTERLHQGVANTVALARYAAEGDLLEEPSLEGLADASRVSYYGVSLGGIMGGVAVANSSHLDRALLHVAGSSWGLTFTRSSNYEDFANLVEDGIDDPLHRQLLYALTQLFWDPVDPGSYGSELADREVLLQYSINDDEVTNFGTELLGRAAGWPVVLPSATAPWGLSTTTFPAQAPALVQFDPLLSDPDNGNQPATVTGAHRAPRQWESAKLQAIDFLVAEPGVINHYCGDEVCTPD